jgi:hypothetical protein
MTWKTNETPKPGLQTGGIRADLRLRQRLCHLLSAHYPGNPRLAGHFQEMGLLPAPRSAWPSA